MFGKKVIKVLLVDDEVEFVTTLAERLRPRELKVDAVFDGTQALAFIGKTEPDVIVLDLMRPGLHGIDVLREIRKAHPKVQVIILTGHGTDQDDDAARKLGGFDFLRKPAELDLLVRKIKEAFQEKVERVMRTKTVPGALFDRRLWLALALVLAVIFCVVALPALAAGPGADAATVVPAAAPASTTPAWVWPLSLFVVSFSLGVVAVLGGVGGGVLYVPIVSGFFPFHLDFVRGAGLLVALAGALAAGPGLLKKGMADLRLSIPVALIASSSAIVGAMVGLTLPGNVIQTALGATILGIVVIMFLAKKSEFPNVPKADALSTALRINGIYHETTIGQNIDWKIHRTPQGLLTFILIGFMAGMFGLGAGWANVPVLNLMMGAPLKVSVATSKFLLSITDTSAAWIYVNNGAIIPMMLAPSIIGIMLGSVVGVNLLARTRSAMIRWMVIGLLSFAGLRALLKGLGWG